MPSSGRGPRRSSGGQGRRACPFLLRTSAEDDGPAEVADKYDGSGPGHALV